MKCYIISYDLKVGGNYTDLYNAIKAYGTWAKITESTWAIVTNQSSQQVRDNLLKYIKNKERLFVIKSGGDAAWVSAMCSNDWLQKHLPKT